MEFPGTRRTPRRFVWNDGWEKEDPESDERSPIFPLAANFEAAPRLPPPPPPPPSPPGGWGLVPRMGLDPEDLAGKAFLPLRNEVEEGIEEGG